MTKKGILTAGILAFILLCILCILFHAGPIQQGLDARGAGVKTLAVTLLEASWSGGKLTLQGRVAKESEKEQIMARAREIYGAKNVIDRLKVSKEVASPNWLPAALGLLPLMRQGVQNAYMKLEGREIVLKGDVPTHHQKVNLLKEAQAAAGPALTIVDNLNVAVPKPGEAKVQASIDELLAAETMEFEKNSDTITPRGLAILDNLVPIIQGAPDKIIEVGGHTDNMGDPQYNLDLSARRANAARQYLITKGVEAKRLTAVGYGQEKPIADNGTAGGRAKNRRIEFKIQ
jgi:OOP family OmpA-OmpF porin